MNRTLAGTDLSPSAVHVIVELGKARQLTATEISETLLLEKSTVSRLLKSLIAKGYLHEDRSISDTRVKNLRLSPQGQHLLHEITLFAEHQVDAALAPLSGEARRAVLAGLQTYASAVKASRIGVPVAVSAPSEIRSGYTPSLIG
ncbi:MAG: DNA-binding MarR family transcriptional regulator [Alphaproteobacteria bacterium]|jgi:DNA-binding MarR family transcriptional regulator